MGQRGKSLTLVGVCAACVLLGAAVVAPNGERNGEAVGPAPGWSPGRQPLVSPQDADERTEGETQPTSPSPRR